MSLVKPRNQILTVSWSAPSLLAVFIVAVIAIFGPWFGQIEGVVAPVTGKVTLTDVREDGEGGTLFRMEFDKLRSCELLGITVRRKGIAVPAGPIVGQPSGNGTLTVGRRVSQVWSVPGPMPLDDLSISWAHRCTFLWVTITDVYP